MSVGPLQDKVWLHLGARVPEHAEKLGRRAGGIVLQGPIHSRRGRELLHSGLPVMLQHDGKRLCTEPTLFPDEDVAWLQHQTGVSLLTSRVAWIGPPSPETHSSLRGAVMSAQRFARLAQREDSRKPIVSMFAADYRWLSGKLALHELLAALSAVDGPIGIMLSKRQDPLDSTAAVEGLIELVTTLQEVVILRCDHGALGAIAHGAKGAAIGQAPSSRHYVPPGQSGWADVEDKTPRVFLPQVAAWWKGSRLGFFDGDPLFDDRCAVCAGNSVARFEQEVLTPEADRHSVECWSQIASELTARDSSARADYWLGLCKQASTNLDGIEDRHDGLPQPASKQLKGWLRSAGVQVF